MKTKLPHQFPSGTKVIDIYTGKVSTVKCSYWQWYAGPPTSDYTTEFVEGGWNKSTNLEAVGSE